jgi:hypothetical protein
MNESELYQRVIKVDVAKPHRGLAGLDSSLPGMTSRACWVLMGSLAAGGVDYGKC